MGTISLNKLGGLALIVAPVLTLVFYFLQPGGAFIDAADPADAQASIGAIVANAGLGQVTSVIIPIGLLTFLFGFIVLQANIRSNGNGDALSRLGLLFLALGVISWVIGSSLFLAIAGADLPVSQAVPTFASLYSAALGIGTVGGLLAGIGFLGIALAISTREDYNKIFALVAAAVALVAIVVTIIGGVDSSQLQTMSNITGVCYLVHTVWAITLGLNLMKRE